MYYKLVAIDLDGTLLTEEKRIPTKNADVLRKLSDSGVEIIIATGRRYWSARKFMKEIDMDLTVVANNGTIIRSMHNDKAILNKYLDKEDFYTLIKEGRKRGLYPVIHVDHFDEDYDIIIELDKEHKKYSSYLYDIPDRYKQIEDLLFYEDPRVLSVVFPGDINLLKEFHGLLNDTHRDKYCSHILTSLSKVGPILEIMGPLGSKWKTLSDYATQKGITREEIVAIGDDDNDIEMIQNAGLGIGMKNSSSGVKKVADIITEKTNDECGVGDILTKIFRL
ncbi:Cof-type HAD-IIB family hydrolase [Proteiniborus sp. MB09-C3]|uniref:Cof-type HAD-IIB family hydrolase n=1 Tax=Proteiniborus sp. MB09-C3 TaxID=3050072 RepID=UPI0025572FB3|nr:Cof-type HAD-IIB family hydrolase [Proteiniborus sp. MB09-C3]WIV13842.1 Cof-type HAD-IIB family hydrolase [Proteiniborus sp. MB09-C3]